MAIQGNLTPTPKPVKELSEEEREVLRIACVRAYRMFTTYSQSLNDSALNFTEYANCFHGIPEEVAAAFHSHGEIPSCHR